MFRKNTLEKTIEKGHKYLKKGEIINAKKMYIKALALDPDNVGILNNLGQIYGMLGDDAKAKGYSELLLDNCNRLLEYEKNKELLIFKANALISLKKYSELDNVLDELLKIDSDNIIALYHKSHYLEKNREYRKALKYIERILKLYPYDLMGLLSKGRILTELNEFDEAEVCYSLVFEVDPKNKAAINLKSELIKKKYNITLTSHDLMLKAIESFEMENFRASESYFKKAIDMDADHDEIWFAQGELFVRMGRITDAIESFKKAFEINPTSGGIEKKEKFFKVLNRMKLINKLLRYEK